MHLTQLMKSSWMICNMCHGGFKLYIVHASNDQVSESSSYAREGIELPDVCKDSSCLASCTYSVARS